MFLNILFPFLNDKNTLNRLLSLLKPNDKHRKVLDFNHFFKKSDSTSQPSSSREHCLKPSQVKTHPEAFQKISSLFEKQVQSKEEIQQMRDEMQEEIDQNHRYAVAGKSVGKVSGQHLKTMINHILKEGEESLEKIYGKKPCEYSCLLFGSTARDDGGAYPDLDYAFLVEKRNPQTVRYFDMLSQYLADRIHLLGESTPGENYGTHACYGGATPYFRSWGWRYQNPKETEKLEQQLTHKKQLYKKLFHQIPQKTRQAYDFSLKQLQRLRRAIQKQNTVLKKEKTQEYFLHTLYSAGSLSRVRGTTPLIATPEELAQWTQPEIDSKVTETAKKISHKQESDTRKLERQLKNIGDYCDYIPSDPTPAKQQLVEAFSKARMEVLRGKPEKEHLTLPLQEGTTIETTVENRSQELFAKVILENSQSFCQKLPTSGAFDIKKELWRFPQTFIAYLCQMHGITEMNSFNRIEELCKRNIIDRPLANELKSVYGFLVQLRAKCQLHYKSEIHQIFPSKEAQKKYIEKLENQYGSPIEELLKTCRQEISSLDNQYIATQNKLLQSISLSKSLEKKLEALQQERKSLYKKLEELNHAKALKKGLVLNEEENKFIGNRVIPFLQKLQQKTINYINSSFKKM